MTLQCQCPIASMDHDAGNCENRASMIVTNPDTNTTFAVCGDCNLSSYIEEMEIPYVATKREFVL